MYPNSRLNGHAALDANSLTGRNLAEPEHFPHRQPTSMPQPTCKRTEFSINNDCLGPPELAWLHAFAALPAQEFPPLPLQVRKMGLDGKKLVQWEKDNEEYRIQMEADYAQRIRRISDLTDLRKSAIGWHKTHPFVWALKIIGEHNFAIEKRIYYQRLRSPKSKEGGTYTQEEIEEIRIKQKNRCRYFRFCGTTFDTASFQIDHRIPVTRGGRNTKDNLQLLCVSCNTSKKSSGHDAFVGKLKTSSERSKSVVA